MVPFLSLPGLRRLEQFFNLDVALRYLSVRDILVHDLEGRILEVGAGGEGITRYASTRTVAVEQYSSVRPTASVRPVIASGVALPFHDRAFDTVLSVDVLEHVRPTERPRFVRECVRVAARRVVLAFPSGEAAAKQDRTLAHRYKSLHGALDKSMAEHLAHGLPNLDDILAAIEGSGRFPVSAQWFKNLNLPVRAWIMKRWMSPRIVDLMLYRLSVVLILVRRWLNIGSCYRVVLDINFAE
jgi:hypothetical protein